ncbi:class I SAM-dependent methyltransferase [Halobacteriovorax sp. XZX-3]|uniref:class I SAM-dependent methyltransferase n=1 Tax=unclassified Halobacteriovorax TaxID=2639665 RepID=UPI003720E42C
MNETSLKTNIDIVIDCAQEEDLKTESLNQALRNYLQKLSSHKLTYQLHMTGESLQGVYLVWKDNELCLFDPARDSSLKLDWATDLQTHLKRNYAVTKEPLFRALKLKGGDIEHNKVVDATLGTGKDACLLLSFGCHLDCFERNPYVFGLALWAYEKAISFENEKISNIFKKYMSISYGQATLADTGSDFKRCFYDPMYEMTKSKAKSALSRKEMEVFKDLVGKDTDQDLYLWSLCTKFPLVCLKRPIKANEVQIPTDCKHQRVVYSGKSTRYERYFLP